MDFIKEADAKLEFGIKEEKEFERTDDVPELWPNDFDHNDTL